MQRTAKEESVTMRIRIEVRVCILNTRVFKLDTLCNNTLGIVPMKKTNASARLEKVW